MVTNELVHSGVEATVEGFEVFPLPTETVETVVSKPKRGRPAGSKNKPKKPVKVEKAAPKGKRGPGRPRVYNGTHRRIVAAALKRHGLTKGIEFLASERKLAVSLTLARSVAEEFGIEFKRGRPAA
jgi:transposase